MSKQSSNEFQNFTAPTLFDVVFLSQYLTTKDVNFETLKEKIFTYQKQSDEILSNIVSLSFIKPLLSAPKAEQVNANDLFIDHFSFDGSTLSMTMFNAFPAENDHSPLRVDLDFDAHNLSIASQEYERNEEGQYELVVSDELENEEINNVLEDFSNIFDIYFTMQDNQPVMNIFFFEDHLQDEDNENEGYVKIYKISFNFK